MTLTLHLGAHVVNKQQRCGALSKFIVDPQKRQVTNLVIEQGFWMLKNSRVLPTSAIEAADDNTIYVDVDEHAVKNAPAYREVAMREAQPDGQVAEPPVDACSICPEVPGKHAIIDADTRVNSTSDTLGRMSHFLIDEFTGEVIHLIAQQARSTSRYIIPSRKIEAMGSDAIRVTLSDAELAHVPRYHPTFDAAIQEQLEERLYRQESPVFRNIQIAVTRNVPQLTGCVGSVAIKYHAEEMARAINGVIDVQNELTVVRFMHSNPPGIAAEQREMQRVKSHSA